MADLAVDTVALRSSSAMLRTAGGIAADLHARGGQLEALSAGAGSLRATEVVDIFLTRWAYGVGVLGHQMDVAAAALEGVALAFEAIESRLTAGAGGAAVAPASVSVFPEPRRLSPPSAGSAGPSGQRWGALPMAGAGIQMSSATHASQLVPGVPDDLVDLAVQRPVRIRLA
jgi:hypothetical protein